MLRTMSHSVAVYVVTRTRRDPRGGGAMSKRYYCDFCGTEVTAQDYCVVGHRRAYSCGAAECERYFRDEERGIEEQAMLDAVEDRFERYW
jgi:hypothetical protein